MQNRAAFINPLIYALQVEEIQKGDTPRGKVTEHPRFFREPRKHRPLRLSQSSLNPIKKEEVEVKPGCRCVIM